MFNLQGSEIIFILLLALVVLGPEKLPGAVKRAMQTYAELRKIGSGFQDEFKSAIDQPMREMRETADLVKNQIDPKKIAEGAERAVEASAGSDLSDTESVSNDAVGVEESEESTPAESERVGTADFVDPFDDPADDNAALGHDAAPGPTVPPVDTGDITARSVVTHDGVDDVTDDATEESA